MDLVTEPVTKIARNDADVKSASEWLDALASGACDEDAFLAGVNGLVQKAPDSGWELLALLDQYFRRGKISAASFGYVKTHLQNVLMRGGQSGGAALRVTPPTSTPAPAAAISRPPAPPISVPPVPAISLPPEPAPSADAYVPAAGGPPAAPERVLAVGDLLRDRYRVQALLGHGGMGTVFEAIDQYRLDRLDGDQRVAIKVLHTAVMQRPRLFAELRREFEHLQSLSHPNVVRVHEFDRDGDLAFFTMEYLSGTHLSTVLAAHTAKPLYRPYAWAILRDMGAAIEHAHARGVVHGDLNPGNVYITDEGQIRVLDFGASNRLRLTPAISEFESSQRLPVATPSFASCEVLEGATADVSDDLYALACVAYCLLTGSHPYRGHSALKARTLRLKPARPSGLDARQWRALKQGLLLARDRRPEDMSGWLGRLLPRKIIPHLPALSILLDARANGRRRLGGLGMRAIQGVAWLLLLAVLAGAGWWAATHDDMLVRARDAAIAQWNARVARSGPVPAVVAPRHAPSVAKTASVKAAPVKTAPSAIVPSVVAAADKRPTLPDSSAAVIQASPATKAPPAATATGTAKDPAAPLDNPVRARLELAVDNVDVVPGEAVAHVAVRRTRTMRGDVSFSWWTESGTAKPGRDFQTVPAHVDVIESGKNSADLQIPLLADRARHDARSFYVVIDEASDNAMLGHRTLTMVTLPESE